MLRQERAFIIPTGLKQLSLQCVIPSSRLKSFF